MGVRLEGGFVVRVGGGKRLFALFSRCFGVFWLSSGVIVSLVTLVLVVVYW